MSIYEQAQKFRRQLIERDSATVNYLTGQYRFIYASIVRSMESVTAQIAAAQADGQKVSQAWLNQQWRYQSFLRDLDREFAFYNSVLDATVAARQAFEFTQGASDASAMIGGQFNRLPVRALESVVSNLRAESPLGRLLASFGPVASERVSSAIRDGVALGFNPRKIAREGKDALGVPLSRALLISRTESIRAYRQAGLQTYRHAGVEKWRWVAAKSSRTCLNCLARDGEIYAVSKPFPAHPACIPAGAVIHTPRVEAATSRYYSGEIVEFTAGGKQLSVTPNHPILTPRGWVAAGLLNESDHVVSAPFPERMLATVNPDYQQMPARIEQIVSAFTEGSGVFPVSVPASAEYFHGDGEGSQINIVAVDGLLRDGFNAAAGEPFGQDEFIGRDSELFNLAGLRAQNPRFDGVLSAAGGFMCRGCVGFMFFGATGSHHQAIRRGLVADFNARGDQAGPDGTSSDAELCSDLVFGDAAAIKRDDFTDGNISYIAVNQGLAALKEQAVNYLIGHAETSSQSAAGLAGLVEFDQVRKISKRFFHGQVYNLQTSTGWYIANGIITHNCRCTFVAVMDDAPVRAETAGQWFERQPDSVKHQMMSGLAFDEYKAGRIRLEDFKGSGRSRKWGPFTYERSVKEILEEKGMKQAA